MRSLRLATRFISGKLLIYIFILMIVVQLGMFAVYINRNSLLQSTETQNKLLVKLYNIVRSVKHAQKNDQEQIIKALDGTVINLNHSTLNISLSKKANWDKYNIHEAYWVISRVLQKNIYFIKASFKLRNHQWLNISLNAYKNVYRFQLLVFLFELLVAGFVIATVWSIQRFTIPLKKFKQAADRLGIDVNASPLIEFGPGIVREATGAMNKMQARLQSLIDMRTQMLAAISHDLRTPLTRMKLLSELMENQPLCTKMNQCIDEMEQMISDILSYAREDKVQEKKTLIDLKSLILSICDHYHDLGKDVIFTTELSRVPLMARMLAVKRALNNIIQNSLKYAGAAQVELTRDSNNIIIIVKDQGPGLADEELKKITTPFYRAPTHRKSIAGTGLGLAVAYEVISRHDGTITIERNMPTGLLVTVTLPCFS